LNEPVAIELTVTDGQPREMRLRGRWRQVDHVLEVWRVEDGWWREHTVARTYFRLLLSDGHVVTVYRDDLGCRWWTQLY
jgi:hypothetical protein